MWTPTTVGFRKEWLIRVGHAQPVHYIPSSVKRIGHKALCSPALSVIVPDTVEELEADSFSGESISLPHRFEGQGEFIKAMLEHVSTVVIRGEEEGTICNAYFLPNRALDCVGNGSPAMAVIDAARTDGPDASNALLDSYYKEIKPKEFPTRFRLALCRYFSVAQTDKALQKKYRDYVRRTREKGRAMLEDLGGDVYLSLMDALGF